MTGVLYACLCFAGAALFLSQFALAQQCYYPNGSKAPEKPCSSAPGSACCPDKWECLDNGLCYYPHDKLRGRYSCTDKDWKSPGCAANLCTYDNTVGGGEDIQQCSNHGNQWCCNGDNVHVKCCDESPSPRPFFKLQDGKAYATIGGSIPSSAPTLSTITGIALGTGSPSPSSSTSGSRSTSSTPPPSNTPSSTVLTTASTITSNGPSGPTTIISAQTVTTAITPPTSSAGAGGAPPLTPGPQPTKTALIVGCAVGVPLALAFIGIMIWLLHKRTQQKKHSYDGAETPDPYATGTLTPDFAGGAAFTGGNKLHKATGGATTSEKLASPGISELESQGTSIGPGRPVSSVPGSAELESGSVAHAPHLVGVGGGNGNANAGSNRASLAPSSAGVAEASPAMSASWGSAPQQGYSPLGYGVPGQRMSWEYAGAGPGPGAGGGGGPVSAYMPYRPPAGHEAYAHHGVAAGGGGGLSNVPEMAELSAADSPPVVVEAGFGRASPPAAAAELGTVYTPPEMRDGRGPPPQER
ncbi:hypothetical protein CC80DRAFT_93702 [Byssothecium circinans]|uniref:Mid2 domain-containing protein n=1 Tax=Byssothecium circinans TaxID=147558 RepID=A0A6A5TUQ9_9PLEO|nr:hypothetical protein CC80DRAFT_93702 [Byssothecium circinans]